MGETLDSMNEWFVQAQDQMSAYFTGCSQNEWIAWGVNSIGFILLVVGIVLFF